MRFTPAPLTGVFIIEPTLYSDERGAFARTYCQESFIKAGIDFVPLQCSFSRNPYMATLRGMHYQITPYSEAKLVSCTRGSVFDVAVDMRADSHTRGQWFGAMLTAENRNALFIPKGFAHGFLTTSDDAELSYMMDAPYVPEAARGLRWNDPALAIDWPMKPTRIADKDNAWSDYA